MSGEQLSAADAASKVKRQIPALDTKGKPTGKFKSEDITEKEVLDFKQYDNRVVVVTTDGQKFEGKL